MPRPERIAKSAKTPAGRQGVSCVKRVRAQRVAASGSKSAGSEPISPSVLRTST